MTTHPSKTSAAASVPHPIRTSTSKGTVAPTPNWTTLAIRATTVLQPGQNWHTNRITLTLTASGNLVLTNNQGKATWSSGTSGTGTDLVFQADGNLVLYTSDGKTLWSTGTAGHDGAELVLQNDANLVVILGNTTLWQTRTAV